MSDRDAFESAFVAVSYLLGRREGLIDALDSAAGAPARALARELSGTRGHAERARVLANALVPIVAALDGRRLG
jgi:hypothetical protein